MSAVYILWLRELKRYSRSRAQIFASLGQPILYLVAFGFGFRSVFQRAGLGNSVQFIAPGVVGMSMLFSSVFSGIGLLWDRQFGFLKETLVAPVPRLYIMAGRTLGGASIAFIQGLMVFVVCLVAGFRPASLAMVPVALLFMALICVVFSALGTAIGSSLQSMQAFPIVMNFLVMPIFFLSGALFPLDGLPAGLAVATRLDPLTYGIDGLRGAFIGAFHLGATLDIALLVAVAGLFIGLGAYAFARIRI